MEVFKLVVFHGYTLVDEALFLMGDEVESKMKLWATNVVVELMSDSLDDEAAKTTSKINMDISNFNLSSCEKLETADRIMMFVTVQKVL